MIHRLFPHIVWNDELRFEDGLLFRQHTFCNKNRPRCRNHYGSIYSDPGIHTCPYGFSSYVLRTIDHEPTIITSIRITDHFKKDKTKNRLSPFSPTLSADQIYELEIGLKRLHKEILDTTNDSILEDTIHEIRKLNAGIKAKSEDLTCKLECTDHTFMANQAHDIFAYSSLISTRLNFFDLEKNPDLSIEIKRNVEVYKKFDKVRYCMNTMCRNKKLTINFYGKCYSRANVNEVFDLLPYVFLENATKYSPDDNDINVHFIENDHYTIVEVKSLGPQVSQHEINDLFLPRFRSASAHECVTSGTGIGLYFAKKICDLNNIHIDIDSSPKVTQEINGVPYSIFTVTLRIPTLPN